MRCNVNNVRAGFPGVLLLPIQRAACKSLNFRMAAASNNNGHEYDIIHVGHNIIRSPNVYTIYCMCVYTHSLRHRIICIISRDRLFSLVRLRVYIVYYDAKTAQSALPLFIRYIQRTNANVSRNHTHYYNILVRIIIIYIYI